ncbi:MAG: preprotein translocase subunit SecG [Bacillota bacterium]|nr:preprotein translocase subunit SecG [Bacillota bacterium]
MSTPQIVISILQMIACLIIIIVVLMQQGKNANLGVITGGAETFFGRNKGRTIEEKLKKWTTIIAALFILLTVALDATTMF